MAKKQGGFQTDKERSKWDQIQKSADVKIEHMLAGQATPDDIKAMSALLAKQSALAGKLFDEGIAGVEATADTIIDKMNKDRIAIGKAPLTPKAQDRLFKQAFQKVLSEATDDILGSIKDQLDEQFANQEDSNKTLVSDAFAKIAKLTEKKTLETVAKPSAKYQVWSKRPAANREVASTLSKIEDFLTKDTPNKSEGGQQSSLLNKMQTWFAKKPTAVTEPNQLLEKANLFGKRSDSVSKFKTLADVEKSMGVRKESDIIAEIKALNAANPELAKTTSVDDQIENAIETNDKLIDKAETHWNKLEGAQEEVDEDKKANTWFRKMASFLGTKVKHEATSGGVLGTLGKALLAALVAPELLGTIAGTIKKHLNYDEITDFISNLWGNIKEGGGNVLDWVIAKVKDFFHPSKEAVIPKTAAQKAEVAANVNKLSQVPANTTAASAAKAIPDLEERLKVRQRRLDAAKKADATNSTPDTKYHLSQETQAVGILQGQLDSYKSYVPVSGHSAARTSAASQTAVIPAPKATPSTTAVVSASPSTFAPGVTVDPANTIPTAAPVPTTSIPTASNAVSMSSFGFSTTDDTLNLLNMGLIG